MIYTVSLEREGDKHMALTDAAVRTARPLCKECKAKALKHVDPECEQCKKIKQVKLSDGHGLYLLVNKSGKYWRYDYKINGKRKTLSIGTYPAIPLAGKLKKDSEYKKGARDLLIDAKAMIKAGVDPSLKKQADRQASIAKEKAIKTSQASDENTFKVIANRWYKTKRNAWTDKHASTITGRLNRHIFPHIGDIPVDQINKAQVAELVTTMTAFGTIETAHRVSQIVRQVFQYACDLGLIELVPMGDMKNIIPAQKSKPMPAITDPKRLTELLKAMDGYNGDFVTCQALKLNALLAVRSGEFRMARWPEFDLDKAVWTIPALHRKLSKADKQDVTNIHIVPLSKQAVNLLKELHQLTGNGNHVFPSVRGDSRPMSENTINAALTTLGFKGEMVGHGWRSVFSTTLNQDGFNPDAIEKQLAHKIEDKIRAAYNRSEYMKERIKMMQHWADYLDKLRLN